MSFESSMNTDLFAFGDEFQRALAQPDLVSLLNSHQDVVSADEQIAAWLAVVSWGRCLVSGTTVSALPDSLCLYEAAARELSLVVQDTCQATELLSKDFDTQQDDLEFESRCHDVLAAARDIWIAYTALSHLLEQVYTHSKAANYGAFIMLLEQASENMDKLEDSLKSHADLLSTLADTSLLENWCAELVEPYSSTMPWWLENGAFQEVMDSAEMYASKTMPDSQQWKHLRQLRSSLAPAEIVPLRPVSHAWFPDPAQAFLAAATSKQPRPLEYRTWRSMDGLFEAKLVVDPDTMSPVSINFYQANQPAMTLAGQAVELAGVSSAIDVRGTAVFDRQLLINSKQQGKPLELIVSGTNWQPIGESEL